jgi:adenylylsulfate reductase subunit B
MLFSCVKICPTQAIEVRGYADFMPMGGVVQPLRSTDSIMWAVRFRNKRSKRFKFPIRTTPEGTIAGCRIRYGVRGPEIIRS